MNRGHKQVRQEDLIFDDLGKICSEKGYLYVILTFCLRDNLIKYKKEISKKEVLQQFNPQRLVRTEISTLLGLALKNPVSLEQPTRKELEFLIKKTEELLEELHFSMFFKSNQNKNSNYDLNVPSVENQIRESAFYSGEGAYAFQYKEFAKIKFQNDTHFFEQNFGFSVIQMYDVFVAIEEIQVSKLNRHGNNNTISNFSRLLFLFQFTLNEVSSISKVDPGIIIKIVNKFICNSTDLIASFRSIGDFNPYNAFPFIKLEEDTFICFQIYSLYEALYETPVFFLNERKEYKKIASKNRGLFTEKFAFDKLQSVFGENRVYTGIEVMLNKNTIISEIDVLVLFGDIAIIVQAKSKRLTIESRKGNISTIQNDFKLAIQDSYDQGALTAKSLLNLEGWLRNSKKTEITLKQKPRIVYPIVLLSDYYPSLSLQVQEFLEIQTIEGLSNPFISDVFTLDVICEFLKSPLYFLSYIDRRANYFNKILSAHELTIFSYHLTKNLWVENDYNGVFLTDDIASEIDAAMIVRRENLPGRITPEGILTKFKNTTFQKLVASLDWGESVAQIELGLFLLKLSEETINDLNFLLKKLFFQCNQDKDVHDFSLTFEDLNTGITFHSSFSHHIEAAETLEIHCIARKYKSRLDKWFGIFLNPQSQQLLFVIYFDNKWAYSNDLEDLSKDLENSLNKNKKERTDFISKNRKIGRNELCPCGSGEKFKKCCINKV